MNNEGIIAIFDEFTTSSSSSDSDEEMLINELVNDYQCCKCLIPRVQNFVVPVIALYNDREFQENFRSVT